MFCSSHHFAHPYGNISRQTRSCRNACFPRVSKESYTFLKPHFSCQSRRVDRFLPSIMLPQGFEPATLGLWAQHTYRCVTTGVAKRWNDAFCVVAGILTSLILDKPRSCRKLVFAEFSRVHLECAESLFSQSFRRYMLVATLENPIFAVLTILIIPKLPRFVEKLDFAEMPLFRRVLEATFLRRLSKIL